MLTPRRWWGRRAGARAPARRAGAGGDAARARLAAEQTALLAALLSATTAPAGFDQADVDAAGGALRARRARFARRVSGAAEPEHGPVTDGSSAGEHALGVGARADLGIR